MSEERPDAREAQEVAVEEPTAASDAVQEPDQPQQPEQVAEEVEAERVEVDLEELQVKARERDEFLALAQRTQADFENYRKRMAREVGSAEERGVARLLRELLPAIDNLDRALGASDGGDGQLVEGFRLVRSELIAALARVGVEGFSPKGERFDPEQHEAMAQQPVEGAEPGTVVEVYQQGYRLRDTVIRPARVVVAA